MKRYTPNSATPIDANTMFLQIGKQYTPFSALHQFFPTLPIICAQVAAKRFMRNTRWSQEEHLLNLKLWGPLKKFKTRSGSYSGLGLSIYVKKRN